MVLHPAVLPPDITSLVSVTTTEEGHGFGDTPTVAYNNVGFDIESVFGSFAGPIVQRIQSVTQPLQPFVDFMRSNVPLLDKLGQQITIASVFFGPGADAFFDAINTVNSIEIPEGGQGAFAPLGSFTVTDPRYNATRLFVEAPESATQTIKAVKELGDDGDPDNDTPDQKENKAKAEAFVGATIDKNDGIKFPIITDPNQSFGMFIGATRPSSAGTCRCSRADSASTSRSRSSRGSA